MELITGTLRNYDWGSKSLIAAMQNRETPSIHPEAEIWYGTHTSAPSLVNGIPLNDVISKDPMSNLGSRVAAKFDGKLPFLLKILAADQPLSLQAHPTLKQAQEGFERENREGIDIHASNRNYRDDNHKPELLVALTEFVAMAGFRPLPQTLEILDALNCEPLDKYRKYIDLDNERDSLRKLCESWINLPPNMSSGLIDSFISSARICLASGTESEVEFVLSNILCFAERYPEDNGILISLLLNFYRLSPGEGIYLDAGNLHAYVSGLAVEIMANSDNVLRGGFTSKHVDKPELIKILNFETLADARVSVEAENEVVSYLLPVEEFRLEKISHHGTYRVKKKSPAILLCTRGSVDVRSSASTITLTPSEAAWAPAKEESLVLKCKNAEVFLAYA